MPWPVEQKYIDEAQLALGTRFPRNLVARLRKLNGGEVRHEGQTWWFHPVWDKSDKRRLSRTSNDIVRETAYARTLPEFPPGGVVIAKGVGPERLILLPSEDDPDQLAEEIYDWDPQHHEGPEYVAASIMDLWVNTDGESEEES